MTVVFLSRADPNTGGVDTAKRRCFASGDIKADVGVLGKCKEVTKTAEKVKITTCYCGEIDLCNFDAIKDDGEAYGYAPPTEPPKTTPAGGSNTNNGSPGAASEASERSVSVSFTVMSLVVTAAQFLRSL